MKVKHFFSEKQIVGSDKAGLMTLIYDCELIYDKKLESVVNRIDEKSVICVYDEYGEVCGFSSVLNQDRDVYIGELFVHQSSRRKGYGKALLELTTNYSKKLGYDSVSLAVGLTNKSAQKFYQSNRYIYQSYSIGSPLTIMKRYNSKSVYEMGGVLYELTKRFGFDDLSKKIEKIENYDDSYKYFAQKDENLVKKRLDSSVFKTAVELIEELLGGNTLLAHDILNGNYAKVKGTKFETAKNLKKSALCVNCMFDLKNQEKVIEKLKEREKTL